IEMNPNRVSKIALPVAGRVTQVLVGLGDFVQKGQPLLRLDSPDAGAAQSAYRQAQAGIAQSKAMLAKAEADLARANDLFANRAIAGKEVIASQTVVTQSHAQLDQAVAALEDARQRLEVLGLRPGSFQQPIVVPATVSGKVIEIAVVPGEYRTDTSAAVMTIADLSTVWAAADVPEADIRYVSAGDQVAIHFGAYPNETFRARVMKVADLLDPQTRTIKVLAELPNPHGRFHPDMFVQMRQSRGSESLPVVPRGAVLETQGKTTVYVERARGEFYEVPVTIAREEGDRIALRSGVKAGDQVVVQGTVLLKGY
ncbi:MAG TPA: efflux RND transporter periplasmic adaptor subunit, partial [Bryobacteraceae bacterium]|nr:efflux RND transporter periplasmic adaptor subunit [Bryobacteraceae bacterium]